MSSSFIETESVESLREDDVKKNSLEITLKSSELLCAKWFLSEESKTSSINLPNNKNLINKSSVTLREHLLTLKNYLEFFNEGDEIQTKIRHIFMMSNNNFTTDQSILH